MTDHIGSMAAGVSCIVGAFGLIFQHVLGGPKIKTWPNDPQILRVIIFALILAMVNRGQNILFHLDEPQGDIPYEGVVTALLLALYFGAMAYATWRRKHTEAAQEALRTLETIASDPSAPPAAEVVRRGVLGSLFARGATINGVSPPVPANLAAALNPPVQPEEKPHD